MPGSNPERLLVKLPDPVPSEVIKLLVVGVAVVAQHTPLAVMVPPPSAVIFPPETAVVKVIEVIAVVVRVGTTIWFVVNETSFPYAVPALLVAYARTWYVVPASNPVRSLVKLPVPVPSVVIELVIVGFAVVDQQIPFAVTVPPPSVITFPPETAVVKLIEVTAVVVIVGATTGLVVNETSFPYAVPALLVAYART
jgi:hypothetical protein